MPRNEADAGPPLHERIFGDVRSRIMSGDWPPGHRIPFEHEFSEQYACSRMTVNKALSRLAAAGLIERRRRSGSFVAHPNALSAVLKISDVGAEVAALGRKHRFEILRRSDRQATVIDRAQLDVPARARVLAIDCRHFAGEAPFCLEQRLVSLAAVPEAAVEAFAEVPPGSWLVSRVPWTRAENRILAENAAPGVAEALGLKANDATLVVVRRTWRDETPITHVRLIYGKSHELVARFSPADSV